MNCIEQEAQSDSLSSQISEQQFLVDIWRGVKALAKYKSKELSGKLEKKEATMKGMDVQEVQREMQKFSLEWQIKEQIDLFVVDKKEDTSDDRDVQVAGVLCKSLERKFLVDLDLHSKKLDKRTF